MSPAHILAEFNKARHWLVPAMVDVEEGDLINELLLNRAQLWRGDDAALVTQLVSGPEPHACLWIGGGKLSALLKLAPGMIAWGRAQGVKVAKINGRPGWARALKRLGFEPDGQYLRMVI